MAVSWVATGPWAGPFWTGLIGALAVLYALPVIIAVVRGAEGVAMVVVLTMVPGGWPAPLVTACLMPRRGDF